MAYSYPTHPREHEFGVLQLTASSFAIGASNQRKICELEDDVTDMKTELESLRRAVYKEPASVPTTSSEDYLHRYFADGISITPPMLVKAPKEHTHSKKFFALKKQWRQETAFTSSPRELFLHFAYQQIIGLGPEGIPFVLAELRDEPGLWLWALQAMTGANPIPDDFNGGIQERAELWLEWGSKRWD